MLSGLRGVRRLLGAAVIVAFGLLVVGIGFGAVQTPWQNRFKRRWSHALLGALGIEFEPAPQLPAALPDHGLVVANHISFTDILVINALLPCTFVAKAEIAAWPLLGSLVRRSGTLFIERGNRRAAHATQDAIAEHLSAGERVAIFPEGTTSDGLGTLPFHGALFQAAVDSAQAVHCLRIGYCDRDDTPSTVPAYVGDMSLMDCLWRIVTTSGLRARIRLVATLPAPHSDRRHLAHTAHQRIAHAH